MMEENGVRIVKSALLLIILVDIYRYVNIGQMERIIVSSVATTIPP